MQIEVVVPDEVVEELDRRYADAYAHAPQSDDHINSARIGPGLTLPKGWEDLEW